MSAEENKADVEAIKNLRRQYMVAQGAGDAEGCLSFWCEDGVLMNPNEPAVVGKDALRSWYQKAFATFSIDFTLTYDHIKIAGDWSFARGKYGGTIVPKAGGEPIQDNGKILEIHRRQPDGTWKWAYCMGSSDNPAAGTH